MKKLFTVILIILIYSPALVAATMYSRTGSNAYASAWTYNSDGTGDCGCTPSGGDIIIVLAGTTVVFGPGGATAIITGAPVDLRIYGELDYTNGGKWELPASSSVVLYPPSGYINGTGSGGSNRIQVGGVNIWVANQGDYQCGVFNATYGGVIPCPFNMVTDTPLPIDILFFKANHFNGINELSWLAANPYNFSAFVIERAINGYEFSQLDTLSYSSKTEYRWQEMAVPGTSYYRLQKLNLDNSYDYSNIVYVNARGDEFTNAYYKDGSLFVSIQSQFSGLLSYTLHDINSKNVFSHSTTIQNSVFAMHSIQNLPPGIYILNVSFGSIEKNIKIFIHN